jgi:uncharacterized protein YigE (DUF2233 family)
LTPLNLKSGDGNFYLKPNGVFLIDDSGASIVESSVYPTIGARPRLAVQSGPLLLADGKMNPQFSKHSENRRLRSGIGVISPERVVFVISRDRVTFYEFAVFFQEKFNCRDALYLDGEISKFHPALRNTAEGREDFAGIFAVTSGVNK